MVQTHDDLRTAEMRREEREAQQWLLQREAANDLRAQLQAAVELLAERSGMGTVELNQALAQRVEANRTAARK